MNPARRDTPERKRIRVFRQFRQVAAITLVVSLVSVGVGIVAVVESRSEFPYNAGGAMLAGAPAFFLALVSLIMFSEAKKTGYSSETSVCFDCCTVLMIMWTTVALVGTSFGFGTSGIYGLVACISEASNSKVCQENATSKFVLSVITILLTGVLFILILVVCLTCCCNAKSFGFLNSEDTYTTSLHNTRHELYSAAGDRGQVTHQIALPERRRNDVRSRSDISNTENTERDRLEYLFRSDPEYWSDDDISVDFGFSPPVRGSNKDYADPPPSYEEVMKMDIQQDPV